VSGDHWLGWYRLRGNGDWHQASEGTTIPQASARLTAYLKQQGIKLKSNLDVVITGGGYPTVPHRVS
jgi:hypothetical protein